VVGLELAEPRLDTGKQVRFVAMGAIEWGDITRQGGEDLRVQINAGVDLVSGQINFNGGITKMSEYALGKSKKRSPDRGKPGLLWFRGGNSDWGKTPITREMVAGATLISSNCISLYRR
jgi:hypothetical protein